MNEIFAPPEKAIVTSLSPEQAAQRSKHIGGSEVACLFGLGYKTELELWLEKAGQIEDSFEPSEWMKAGIFMEPGIAAWVADRTGYTLQRVNRYISHKKVKGWGASLDYEVINHPDGAGVAEIKRVNFFVGHRQWAIADEEMEAPPHIEMQLQHQLGATGREWGLIGADIGGNLIVIERERDDDMLQVFEEKIEGFWESIKRGIAPEPNLDKDLATLKRLYPESVASKVVALNANLRNYIKDLEIARGYVKAGNAMADAAQCGIFAEVGDAEAVDLGDWNQDGQKKVLNLKTQERKGYTVQPSKFRAMKFANVKEDKPKNA